MAVVASLDAGLLAAAVVLLGRPRPPRQVLAYLIGGIGLSIAFGLVIVFALHGTKVLKDPPASVTATIEVIAGGLLLVVAVAVTAGRKAQWHPRRRRREKTDHGSKRPSVK